MQLRSPLTQRDPQGHIWSSLLKNPTVMTFSPGVYSKQFSEFLTGVFYSGGNIYGDNYFEVSFSLWDFKCMQNNDFPSKLPWFIFWTPVPYTTPNLCRITDRFPVLSRIPQSKEISIRTESKVCFRCRKTENSWKEISNGYWRIGMKMGFLIEIEDSCN